MESITAFVELRAMVNGRCVCQQPASLSRSRLTQSSGRPSTWSQRSSHPSSYGSQRAVGAVAGLLGFRVRRRCLKESEAEALQKAWLFDAALEVNVKNVNATPRAKALKAAALVGLERFSEARQVLDEIDWKDVLVAAEAGINQIEFRQRCEVLERQNVEKRFLFSEIFAPMLRARESGRDPAMPMTPTAALLPPVPEVANGIEVRSSSAGRGLFVTGNLKGGDVVLCGLPLARCVNSNFGEPLVPALQKASESSPHVRRVLSLLSDGTDLPEVSLNDFSWRTSRTFDEKGSHISHDQLTRIVRINSFDLFGSSALFGAILGEIEKVPEHSKFIKVMSCLNSPSYDFFLPAIDFVTLIRFEIGSFCEGRRLLLHQTLEFVPTEMSFRCPSRTSMANHSCCPSASSMAVGNSIFVRANRNLQPGEELQISYFDVLKPYQLRQERTKSWSFQCECPRCSFERNLPSHLQEIGVSVDVVESAAAECSSIEAQWLRASHLATYMKELEELFPLSKEADQRRKAMLQAMETTDPASFTHIKLSFLDWLTTKSLKGSKDPETLKAMQYCDRIHQARYGKIPGPELVSLMKCTQQATQSIGVGEEFCNPWARERQISASGTTGTTGTTNTTTATVLLD